MKPKSVSTQEALATASCIATARRSKTVHSSDLFEALFNPKLLIHPSITFQLGVDAGVIRQTLRDLRDEKDPLPIVTTQVPMTADASRVLASAQRLALFDFTSTHIDPEHLLLALLEDSKSASASLAADLNITFNRVQDAIKRIPSKSWDAPTTSASLAPLHVDEQEHELDFDLYVDPGNADVSDLVALFRALSDLHRACGGTGLQFKDNGQGLVAIAGVIR